MKPSTEELKENLQKLVDQYNEAIQVQNNCKEQIIAVQAVIEDREDREDGNTNNSNSTNSKN